MESAGVSATIHLGVAMTNKYDLINAFRNVGAGDAEDDIYVEGMLKQVLWEWESAGLDYAELGD